jgi:hypothetical protein
METARIHHAAQQRGNVAARCATMSLFNAASDIVTSKPGSANGPSKNFVHM